MVHHSEKILQIIQANPRSPLANIPIFFNQNLLKQLKPLVVTTASIKVPRVTGIPPHVSMIVTLQDLIKKFEKESQERRNLFDKMGQMVSEKLEAIAADNGTLTRNSVKEILASEFGTFKQVLETEIKKSVRDTIGGLSHLGARSNQDMRSDLQVASTNDEFTLFSYSGRFFHVPSDFVFPEDVKRMRAWRFWLLGIDFKGTTRIRPFRKLQPSLLPTKELKTQYRNEWKPILSKMEKAPGLTIPNNVNEITNAFVDLSFVQATNHLKTNLCSFIWTKQLNHETWTVGTWSTKTLPNQIRRHGTDKDKESLPPPTHRNQPHREKRTLQRIQTERSLRRQHLIVDEPPPQPAESGNNSTQSSDNPTQSTTNNT